MAQSGKRNPLHRMRRAVPAILLAILGTYVLNRMGTLHALERLVLDLQIAVGPPPSSPIAIVEISDKDYDDIFDGRSPLDAAKFQSLIGAVARSRPAVIGVDIDTSHRQFRDFKIDPDWPPVIWEREIFRGLVDGQLGEPLDVLGAQDPRLNANSGVPMLLDDPEDKVTRLYTRCVETKAGPVPSFVFAIAAAYGSGNREAGSSSPCNHQARSSEQPLFIRYSLRPEGIYKIGATSVLGISGKKEDGGEDKAIPGLEKKIVLVGGTYRHTDRHFTPLGSLPGVVILANAIQTELDGGGVEAHPKWQSFILEFTAGSLLVILFHVRPIAPGKAFLCGLLLAGAISAVFGLLTFRSLSGFVNFAPTLLAVLIFELYEHARHGSILEATAGDSHTETAPRPDA